MADKLLSDTDIAIKILRYQEWRRERKTAAYLHLGGQMHFDGWGHPQAFRVLGYGKSIDKAVELGLAKILPKEKAANKDFYAELTLQLWTPSGPKR